MDQTSQSNQLQITKVYYNNQVKLIKELGPTFNDLEEELKQKLKINSQESLVIKYKDKDNDMISIQDTEDLDLFKLQGLSKLVVESEKGQQNINNNNKDNSQLSFQEHSQYSVQNNLPLKANRIESESLSNRKSIYTLTKVQCLNKYSAKIIEFKRRHTMQMNDKDNQNIPKCYVISNTGLQTFPPDTVLRCVSGLEENTSYFVGPLAVDQVHHLQIHIHPTSQVMLTCWRLSYKADHQEDRDLDIIECKYFGPRIAIQVQPL